MPQTQKNGKERETMKRNEKPSKKKEENKVNDMEKETVVTTDHHDDEDSSITDDIDCFLAIVLSLQKDDQHQKPPPERPPDSIIENFLSTVDNDLSRYESNTVDRSWLIPLLDNVDRVARLSAALSTFSPSEVSYRTAANRTSTFLQRAMSFLEEEFKSLLEDCKSKDDAQYHDADRCILPAATNSETEGENPPLYHPETVDRLHRIADIMISAGYESECCQAFSIARHNAFEAGLSNLGFQRVGFDDVQKMQWQSLEGGITTWIQAFCQSISIFFPRERNLCESVFCEHRPIASSLFNNLARGVLIQLLNFAEAVAVTKGSAEKLFKFLDMYETLRDVLPEMDALFPGNEEAARLKLEISSARSRLGEAAVAIFGDLENSIKVDVAKTPVPGGAVHPLTRYVMNYLKYACEYKKTLEEIFAENQRHVSRSSPSSTSDHTSLVTQLIGVMDLLDSNLEAKSKLYKESALSCIFLMNNGRYIVKKIKESAEIYELVGDSCYRKRSGDLRQYHKNYQRDTWGKLLGCFKDEGFMVKGNASKLALKERMKSFNTMLEEIHKDQSTWVVSDEQLKSELRVSISAVLVPAYRSFLGRYRQNWSGKQSEKYIKFSPEDLEAKIDELFEGNSSSHGRRR